MTFEQCMQLTRTVSSNTAFEDPECEAYFNILMSLPKDSLIVEIGLEYGRSSSIALQVAKEKQLRYWGIDPFPDALIGKAFVEMMKRIDYGYDLSLLRSKDVDHRDNIHAILIDGDHSYEAVTGDCEHFLPYVVQGGYALFHDFGRDSLPDVYNAVMDYFSDKPEWAHAYTVDTLAVWSRLTPREDT